MSRYRIILLLSLLVLVGCRTKKVEENSTYVWSVDTPQGAFVESLTRHDCDTSAFIKAVGYITVGENTMKGRLQIRWRKDEIIQISVLPAIVGVELCRVAITLDSVYVIDRFHKKYMSESLAKVQREIPFEISFASLQSMLLTAPFLPGGKTTAEDIRRFIISEDDKAYYYKYSPERPAVDYLFVSDKRACVESTTMSTPMGAQRLMCKYLDYCLSGNMLYPQCMGWILEGIFPQKVVVTFDNITPEWNTPQKFSYVVSSRYTKSDIISMVRAIM